jgi:biopolymer transport protein ExbB
MKTRLFILIAILISIAVSGQAQDVRDAARKARADRQAAELRAQETLDAILADEAKLTAEVTRLEARQKTLENEIADLERREVAGQSLLSELEARWSESELGFREISGNVRLAARDLGALIDQSPLTALNPERSVLIKPILTQGYFPDIDDITAMVDVYFDEAAGSGQVALTQTGYVNRAGLEITGSVLTIGRFTAVYEDGDEVGFLRYAPDSRRFHALSSLPDRGQTRTLHRYLDGDSESMIIDMSGGVALQQVTHRQGFTDQLRAGGPLVYPLALIALAALGIILVKAVFLNRVGKNTDKYMTQVNDLAAQGDWDGCQAIVNEHKGEGSPVNHVIEAGLGSRHADRETLESVLQESILRELPRLEGGLSILAVLGAVAPLLGLLGTVTGMIDTFRVITLFGTGDPKLMSGGISEALITTELGLAVAIPIMLIHTLLSRRVNGIIGDMEEKAVSLANIIQKERARNA